MSSTKRAWVAIAAFLLVLTASAVAYLLYLHRSDHLLAPPIAGLAPRSGAAPAAAIGILNLLPPDAPAVAYIDVAALRKLKSSPLASILGLVGTDPNTDRDYQEFVRDTGFDYTRDLDEAAVALWPASAVTTPDDLGENRALAIAEGRFNQPKIKARALRYGKLVGRSTESFYEVPGKPPVALEFLSANRIALGSGHGAEKLLLSPPSTPRAPAMQARIDRVAAAPIFAVARTDHLPPSFYDIFQQSPQLGSLAHDVTSLTLAGEPTGDRIQMTLDAECNSVKNALEIATLLDGLRMLGSVALADPKTRGQMTKEQASFLVALSSHAKVTRQNRWVRLSLDLTPAMLGETDAQANASP
jgi:hypothetical protein